MFCPLCKSEYRPGFSRCSECNLDLVESLDAPEVRANPPMLLWSGVREDFFEAVRASLADQELPVRAIEPQSELLRRLRPSFEVWVLRSDFERATLLALEAVQGFQETQKGTELCPLCSTSIPVGFSRCPECRQWLTSAELHSGEGTGPNRTPDSAPAASESSSGGAKHCALCGLVYSGRFSHCSICGIELSEGTDPQGPPDARVAREPLVVAWRGGDPIAAGRILAALRDANIPSYSKATHDHLAFGIAIPRPMYEILVFQSDLEVSRSLIAPIPAESAFAGLENLAEETEPPTAVGLPAQSTRRKWKPAQATEEIWVGEDPGVAKLVRQCLDENGVPHSSAVANEGRQCLLVRPEDAEQSREILRELLEGSSLPESVITSDSKTSPAALMLQLLSWLLISGLYIRFIFLFTALEARQQLPFPRSLLVLNIIVGLGALWMVYDAIRHEYRPLRYVMCAIVPFASVWYFFARYRTRARGARREGSQ